MIIDDCHELLRRKTGRIAGGSGFEAADLNAADVNAFEACSAVISSKGVDVLFAKKYGGVLGNGEGARFFRAMSNGGERAVSTAAGDILLLPAAHDGELALAAYPFLERSNRIDVKLKDPGQLTAYAGALGKTFASLHSSMGRAFDRYYTENDVRPCWRQFNFMDVSIEDYALGPGADYEGVLKYVQNFPGFAERVALVQARFGVNGFIHGDPKFDNVFMDEDAKFGIRLVDIDDAGPGDRAWDLGVITGEFLRHWLDSVEIDDLEDLESSLGASRIPFEDVAAAIAAFCADYARHDDAARQQLDERADVILYFAGRYLISSVVSVLSFNAQLARSHWARLHVGANLVAAPEGQFGLLHGETA